jgi:hypothetical protein
MPRRELKTQRKTKDALIRNPRLLSVKGAAAYMGWSVWTMREMIWAGHIPVVQVNPNDKQWIDTNDLEAFIQHNKRTIT